MTAAKERKRMSAADRREQILDITQAIVATEGFYAATPGRIAEEAGITRPVLYQQFGELSGVFVELVDREAQRAARQFAEAVAVRGGRDPFGKAFEGILQAVDSQPATWRLFLLPPEGAPPALHERLALAQGVVRGFLEQEIRRAFPDMPDPEYMARIIQAAGRELLQLRLTEPAQATSERLLRLIHFLRSGLPVSGVDQA